MITMLPSDTITEKTYQLHFIPKILFDILDLREKDLNERIKGNETKIYYNELALKKYVLIDIIHNMLLKYYFKRENDFPLYSVYLKEKYGKNYNAYMNFLMENNVVQISKDYVHNKSSRRYRLNSDILNGEMFRIRNYDKILLRKFNTKNGEIHKKDVTKNIISYDIKKRLVEDLYYVSIDMDRAINYLKQVAITKEVYTRNLYSVEAIRHKHIFYNFDSYGRFHSNFTILKSYIRKNCLLLENEAVFEIDISNSQPRFLVVLMEQEQAIVNKNEFDLFKYLVNNGKYYQYITDTLNLSKSDAKKMTYKILFGRNIMKNGNNLDIQFNNLFPTIHKFIRDYKAKKGSYKVLSHILQKMESELVFNSICKEAYEKIDGIKLITVHDSIICQGRYSEYLETIFNSYIDNMFIGFIHEDKKQKELIVSM
jgi:hypothetical protein